MAAFFLELFSEEIPARMQARAVEDLLRLVTEALGPLNPTAQRGFSGPRRIAMVANIAAGVAASTISERGPRANAPEQALAGFLRKHGATKEDLREEAGFWVLEKAVAGVDAAALIAGVLPGLLRRFPWPKSMRWGGTSSFTWVRPLRRITCLLDGAIVAFDLRDGEDDGHGLVSSNLTEGHRFLSPSAFAVTSCAEWQAKLRAAHVIVDAVERRALVKEGVAEQAAIRGLAVVDDPGLLDEVAGLVEWPVVLTGAIDAAYMDLPAEVMQVSMRVNQRYFALRDGFGAAAPFFAFAANVVASDGGAAIIAGNERVLRARFSDARHFWDLDRTRSLESRVAALDGITFHAKLGTQGQRTARLMGLASVIAPFVKADAAFAERAAKLAKADLTTGMVGEFPELQGVMGRYYALHDGEEPCIAEAIQDHYAPKGRSDAPPTHPVAIAVALADKLDLLAGFFGIGEKPTGAGDPYALRRAALGVIRIIREHRLRLSLTVLLTEADKRQLVPAQGVDEILDFLLERLRVQLRAEGARHDVLSAVLGIGRDDDLTWLLARTDAVAGLLGTADGTNLLAAAKRAANILRIEDKKDGPHEGAVGSDLLELPAEIALADALDHVAPAVVRDITAEKFSEAMGTLASLRPVLDDFFEKVTVNDIRPQYRRNRLALLARVRATMSLVADFSKIDG